MDVQRALHAYSIDFVAFMFNYFAYGLTIASAVALPELTPADEPHGKDVALTIVAGLLSWSAPESHDDWFNCELCHDHSVYLSWEGVAVFRIAGDGSAITYAPAPGVEPALMRQPLLGPVLGCALRNRGYLVLHASAAELSGSGVCMFLGRSGAGKSTMAAALQVRGHHPVSDDVVALAVDADSLTPIRVLNGFPRQKLWPDSLAAIGHAADDFEKIHTRVEKFVFAPLAKDFESSARLLRNEMPLCAAFELRIGPELAIREIAARDALLLLLENCFVPMLSPRLAGPAAAREFLQCARVAREIGINSLVRPADLTALDAVARRVECFARSDGGGGVTAAASETAAAT